LDTLHRRGTEHFGIWAGIFGKEIMLITICGWRSKNLVV